MKIWTVDAFTNKPFHGNFAGVVFLDEYPSNDRLLSISSELNLSETGFIKKIGTDHYQIRWFTPTIEIPLCGHVTLAASHVLFQEGLIQGHEIIFECLRGQLRVTSEKNGYVMDFPLLPVEIINFNSIQSAITPIFGKNILGAALSYPIKETPMRGLILEFDTEKSVKDFVPDFKKIAALEYRSVLITAKSSKPYDFASRIFPPKWGVNEDPVSGSAHCALVDYWRKKMNKTDFHALVCSKRSGEMLLSIQKDPQSGIERVKITGQAVIMIKGDLNI